MGERDENVKMVKDEQSFQVDVNAGGDFGWGAKTDQGRSIGEEAEQGEGEQDEEVDS
jgi:hypothetical protein